MRLTSLLLIPAAAGVAAAQQLAPAAATGNAPRPAPRALGAVVATSTDSITMVGGVRALPGGKLLVNDPFRRRVLLLDERLGASTIVVDSASGAANSYGPRGGGLVAWKGDSTLFVDPASLSMLVVDPAGQVARVMSVPRADDAMALANPNAFGTPGLDAKGRLVYRAMPSMRMVRREGPPGSAPGAAPGIAGGMPQLPDTMPLVRVDLASRKVDTLAWLKVPRPQVSMTTDDKGNMEVRVVANPLPVVDDWAVTSDGQVAVLRGRDYRVDWVQDNGTLASSGRLPFDWKRMSDDDKAAFIDSVKAVRARQGTGAPTPMMFGMGGGGAGAPPPGAGGPGGAGGPVIVTRTESRDGGGPPRSETRTNTAPQFEFVAPSELPDYRPAFFANAAKADRDGNLWIRTTAAPTVQGATVYDVVDRKGALVDRVQVPAGRQVVGFASDGTVVLAYRDGTFARLEKARLR